MKPADSVRNFKKPIKKPFANKSNSPGFFDHDLIQNIFSFGSIHSAAVHFNPNCLFQSSRNKAATALGSTFCQTNLAPMLFLRLVGDRWCLFPAIYLN